MNFTQLTERSNREYRSSPCVSWDITTEDGRMDVSLNQYLLVFGISVNDAIVHY